MIDILLKNHNYKHDLFELIRVFFPEKELRFIEKGDNTREFLIESILVNKPKGKYTVTRVYKKNQLVKENKEHIDNINIKNYNVDKLIKIGIKKSIYNSLIELTNISAPWGILTGIRPMKIVHKLIDYDLDTDTISDILTKDYKLHKSKVDQMLRISKIQRKYIYPLNKDRYSIYIGIPFCPTRCSYCSFPAFKIGKDYNIVKRYVDTLLHEIEATKNLMEGRVLNTIYIGGGTPTAIKTKDLEEIIKIIKYNFPQNIQEFTVEAGRPDTINKDTLKMLKYYGVNRISINPQTMNEKTLERIERSHDIKSTISAYSLAKDIGFDIINMDIILGLPGEGEKEIKYTLNEIEKLDPDNLTVHTLALKKGSKLLKEQQSYLDNERVNIIDMLEEVEKFTKSSDLIPYYLYRQKQILGNLENIGYSKENMESIYNIAMMEEKETVIGLGLGAVSKIYNPESDKIKRIPNFKSLKDYNERIEELMIRKKRTINKIIKK
ncbi:MAG TPA: coproporphyrinogen dehydrogenase HemZ [Tissierellaceae bacterium]|nr:coproporphyrinogen dehydrogenase HemZ [Tissierellaceae bacterium]